MPPTYERKPMLTTHIPQTLITELTDQYPNTLPNEADYIHHITSEQIAFRAGIQHIIKYLTDCANIQDTL